MPPNVLNGLPVGRPAVSAYEDAGLPLPRVLVVDDHPLYSDGLRTALQDAGLVLEVAIAASVNLAKADLSQHPDTDLVMLDLSLPGESGLQLLQWMETLPCPVPVVVISSCDDETTVATARAAGAVGFMSKSSGRDALCHLLRTVSAGESCFPSLLAIGQGSDHLTPRQYQVLRCLAEGMPNKRICQALGLTEHTVKTHLKSIFQLLGVHNRTACIAQARDMGLI